MDSQPKEMEQSVTVRNRSSAPFQFAPLPEALDEAEGLWTAHVLQHGRRPRRRHHGNR
jgi:hypothetical protein